jgi:hypothetical protein
MKYYFNKTIEGTFDEVCQRTVEALKKEEIAVQVQEKLEKVIENL